MKRNHHSNENYEFVMSYEATYIKNKECGYSLRLFLNIETIIKYFV